ncbi:uncharacterized protein [Manis javanica]|uniref:uncharacterized protein isoform X2 n=1 Tax=Manis javanica TaxID=9974 RepID=UPI003C6CDC8A
MMAGRGHGSGAGAGRRKEVFPASWPQCLSPLLGPVCGARREKPMCFAPVAAVAAGCGSLCSASGRNLKSLQVFRPSSLSNPTGPPEHPVRMLFLFVDLVLGAINKDLLN